MRPVRRYVGWSPDGDIEPVLDDVMAARRERTSKRNRGFPGNHYGAASGVRIVTTTAERAKLADKRPRRRAA